MGGSKSTGLSLSSVLRALAIYGAVMLGVGIVVLPLAYYAGGADSLWAAAAALAICLASGTLAMFATELFSRSDQLRWMVVLGMFIRMGLPLAACGMVYRVGGVLADGGMVYYLLGFYLLMLVVETGLMLGRFQRKPGAGDTSASRVPLPEAQAR